MLPVWLCLWQGRAPPLPAAGGRGYKDPREGRAPHCLPGVEPHRLAPQYAQGWQGALSLDAGCNGGGGLHTAPSRHTDPVPVLSYHPFSVQ